MTDACPIPTDGATETGTGLALLANLDDLVAGRDRAIDLYVDLYDGFHAARDAAASASIGGNLPFGSASDRYDDPGLTPLLLATGPVQRWSGHDRITTDARDDWTVEVTKRIDRACWSNLMAKMGFDQLLDKQARDEFRASIEDTPPPFTADNARATFQTLWAGRRDMYLRGIANVFMKLDRRFRSHDAFGIGNRVVFSHALSIDYSGWGQGGQRDAIDDVERIFRELDGLGPLEYGERISNRIACKPAERPQRIEDRYFKVDSFKNGNVHLWFTNKPLLKQVNDLLLEYYKPVEGDVGEGPSYEAGPLYHSTPAKNYGLFPSPPAVVDAVLKRADIDLKGLRVLEPSAGTGAIAKAARAAGALVSCVELQAGLAHELKALHGFHDVHRTDFLTMPSREIFDVVLMNPPFDRGRDCDHVRHAYRFLKPGGTLVAVMSARAEHGTDARHKALHDLIKQCDRHWGRIWEDLPERSFAEAGTNVNTVTLRLRKPR